MWTAIGREVTAAAAAPAAVADCSSLSPLEGWRAAGAAGQPAFGTNWSNYGFDYATAAFRKDRDGLVHLKGGVKHSGGDVASSAAVFVLPAGYRPAESEVFAVASTNGSGALSPDGGIVEIVASGSSFAGSIFVYGDSDERFISLSGITFYAG